MKRGGLIYALAQLSPRERGLLLMLCVVILPVAVVYLAVMPLMEARDAAKRSAMGAETTLAWVADQVRALPVNVGEAGPRGGGQQAIGISGIEESLVQFDLRDTVSQLANRADGGVDLSLDEAPFADLGEWLQFVTPGWGYQIAAFRVDVTSPGLVNARFELGDGQ